MKNMMNTIKTLSSLFGLLIAGFVLAQTVSAQQNSEYSQETQNLMGELGLKAQVTVAAIHENETLAGNEDISSYAIHIPSMNKLELGMELDTSEPQNGFMVLSVEKDSLAENLGLASNDRILIFNHFEVNEANRDVILNEFQALRAGDDLNLLVKQDRNLKRVTMTIEENLLPAAMLHVGLYQTSNPVVSSARESFPALEGATVEFKTGRTRNSRINSGYDKNLDFSQYGTYNFSSPLRIEAADFHGQLALAFSAAVEREMHSRGYVKSDRPDILVNVSVDLEDKKQPPRRRRCPSYADYYWRQSNEFYNLSGREEARLPESRKTYCDYTEGSVTIDMVDVKQNRGLWQGISLLRIDYKEREFLNNGSSIDPADGSISVNMDGVVQRSTYLFDIARLSDEEIDNGYLFRAYVLDDVATMFKGAPFREHQE